MPHSRTAKSEPPADFQTSQKQLTEVIAIVGLCPWPTNENEWEATVDEAQNGLRQPNQVDTGLKFTTNGSFFLIFFFFFFLSSKPGFMLADFVMHFVWETG
jgi:hypothetical protein